MRRRRGLRTWLFRLFFSIVFILLAPIPLALWATVAGWPPSGAFLFWLVPVLAGLLVGLPAFLIGLAILDWEGHGGWRSRVLVGILSGLVASMPLILGDLREPLEPALWPFVLMPGLLMGAAGGFLYMSVERLVSMPTRLPEADPGFPEADRW